MSKKSAIILILFITFLLIGGLLIFYFYFYGQASQQGLETPSDINFGNTPSSGTKPPKPSSTETPGETSATPSYQFSPEKVLQQLTNVPTAGAVAIAAATGTTAVRYVERGTGHVYELPLDRGTATRISNETIPKIEEAFFKKKGEGVIVRYAKDDTERIETFSALIKPKDSNPNEGELEGTFLSPNLHALALSPATDKLFTLLEDRFTSRGIISDFDGNKKIQIASFPFTEVIAEWPSEKVVTLTSKAASGMPGFMLTLNPATGSYQSVLSNISGLTTLTNPEGTKTLYSTSADKSLSLSVYEIKTGRIVDIPLQTLPEKCVWSKTEKDILYCGVPGVLPSASYPEHWYQGLVLFSDDIWKINTSTGNTTLIQNLEAESRRDIDTTHPFLNEKGTYLFFIDKHDLTLWALKLGK
jgi:hypothetical protein